MNGGRAITVTILALFLSLSHAPCSVASLFYGFKGGLSSSSPSRSGEFYPGVHWSTRVGFALAAQLEIPLSPRLSLLAEPMFVQRGMHVEWPGALSESDNTSEYSYLELPLSVKVRFPFASIQPFLFAGPYAGISVSQRSVFDNGQPTADIDNKSYDLGLAFGGGLELPLDAGLALVLDGRYTVGLVDISESRYASIKNRGVIILGGLAFGR